jgi:hypothetical protein
MDKKLYAWHPDGTSVDGFPMTPLNQQGKAWPYYNVSRTIILADYDGDDEMEIFLATAWTITIIDGDGTILTSTDYPNDGKPIYYAEGTLVNNPTVGDLDNDGNLELIAFNSKLYVWDLPNSGHKADWPMLKYNAARTAHPIQPAISADQNVTALRAIDDLDQVEVSFNIHGDGNSPLNWSSTTPRDITLSPESGQLLGDQIVKATVSPSALSLGENTFNLTLSATSDGDHVINSPLDVTITIIVAENVYNAYLPATIR